MLNISIPQQIVDVVDVMQTHVDFLLALAACVYILLQFKEANPSRIKLILIKITQTYYAIKEAVIEVRAERKASAERLKAANEEYDNVVGSLLYRSRYEQLLKQYNDLIKRVNQKGGDQFLKYGSIQPQGAQISQDEIKTLIQLCHPDKHNGKESAVEITKKLLSLRK